MKLDQVLKHFDTTVSGLAIMLAISQSAVSNWRRRGEIPELQQIRLAELSGGKLKIDPKFRLKNRTAKLPAGGKASVRSVKHR